MGREDTHERQENCWRSWEKSRSTYTAQGELVKRARLEEKDLLSSFST